MPLADARLNREQGSLLQLNESQILQYRCLGWLSTADLPGVKIPALRVIATQEIEFDRIIFATSSGGTQAGMIVGAALFQFSGIIQGISVDLPVIDLSAHISALAMETAEFLGHRLKIQPDEIVVEDGYLGDGYAVMTNVEKEAINLFAQQEGILLDPVYTGRAAGGMIDLIKQGKIPPDERILFWHTGGTPALFAYGDVLV